MRKFYEKETGGLRGITPDTTVELRRTKSNLNSKAISSLRRNDCIGNYGSHSYSILQWKYDIVDTNSIF